MTFTNPRAVGFQREDVAVSLGVSPAKAIRPFVPGNVAQAEEVAMSQTALIAIDRNSPLARI